MLIPGALKKYSYIKMKNQEMLDALFENATEGILVTDMEGTIVLTNPKSELIFGYTSEELINQKIEILIPQRFRGGHVGHRQSYHNAPSTRAMGQGMNLFAVRKDGSEFPAEISLSFFKTSTGTFTMSFIIDITNRKKIDDQLKEVHKRLQQKTDEILSLNNQLEQKVKERTRELAMVIQELAQSRNEAMQALEKEKQLNDLKSKFVTTASHEFRTPLGTILSSASLISKYVENDEQEKRVKHIARIKSAVNNLTEILNDFLSIDKLEEGVIKANVTKIVLSELISKIIDEMNPLLKEKQNFIYTSTSDCNDVVITDVQLLKNIVINLLSNAIKYSGEKKDIFVNSVSNSNTFIISVKDQGIGIAREEQPFLFDRFFRANNATNIQGTGLGLNIVKKYLDLLGGTISFESELNEGTTFTITIPNA